MPADGPVMRVANNEVRSQRRLSLGPLFVSRALDQLALGAASLLIARRLGTEAFAPFAVLFVVYALAAALADGGLAFAVLRTPPGARLSRASLAGRRTTSLGIAVAGCSTGWLVGGATGTWLAAASLLWGLAGETFVRRAVTQRAGAVHRQATAEAVGAAIFLAIAVGGVRHADDLWVLFVAFSAKVLAESCLLRDLGSVFSTRGSPARARAEWLGQAATYATANVDYLLIGLLLGPAALSVYTVSFRLAAAVTSVLAAPLTRSAFIDLAAGAGRRDAVHARLLGRIARAGFVGALATVAGAPLAPVVMGGQWGATSGLVAILALAIPWRLGLGAIVALGVTGGRAVTVVRLEVARLALTGSAIALGSVGGITFATGCGTAATILGVTFAHRRLATSTGLATTSMPSGVATAAAIVAVALGAVLGA